MEPNTALAKALEQADTKITRSELIDLIQEEMESELTGEIKAVRRRLDALKSPTYSFDDVKHLYQGRKFKLEVQWDSYNRKTTARLTLNNEGYSGIGVDLKDPKFAEAIQERAELQRELERLEEQHRNMVNSKRSVKVAIIKKCLEGTKDGRAIMDQVAALKSSLRKQLTAGNK